MNDGYAVYVPSRSRFDKSLTLDNLRPERSAGGRPFKIFLVVPTEQRDQYRALAEHHGASLLACPLDGIARTRWFIGRHAKINKFDRFIMFDDDLRFYHRTSMEDWHLTKNEFFHNIAMISHMADLLKEYAHGSIDIRQGNNARNSEKKYPTKIIGRMLRVLGYRTDAFLGCTHGRVPVMEDFDVTLQLLRKGYANFIITNYVQDQQQTQLPGGCSDYRDHEKQEAAAHELKRLHPHFVELVEKKNSTGGAFGHRTDVRIQWEKAYRS